MSFSTAPRRPSRVVAAALLLILHLVAIGLFLSLQATREHSNERLVTLLLLALTRPAPTTTPRTHREAAAGPPTAPKYRLPLPIRRSKPSSPCAASTTARRPSPRRRPECFPPATAAPASARPGKLELLLAIPKDFFAHPPPLTPAQEAMQDPRSNRLVLTKQEQMDVDFGVFECIAWQREPDGSIYRGPGHYQRIQGISTNPFTTHKPGHEDRGQECVK